MKTTNVAAILATVADGREEKATNKFVDKYHMLP